MGRHLKTWHNCMLINSLRRAEPFNLGRN